MIYVGLPSRQEQALLFKYFQKSFFSFFSDNDYEELSEQIEMSDHYAFKEVAAKVYLSQEQKVFFATSFRECEFRPDKWVPCSSSDAGSFPMTHDQVPANRLAEAPIFDFNYQQAMNNVFLTDYLGTVVEEMKNFKKNPIQFYNRFNEERLRNGIVCCDLLVKEKPDD